MSRSRVVVATRKSALALAQSRAFIARLAALHPNVTFEELLVTTTGDVVQDRALSEIGGKGLFVKEIEEALLDGRADIAIHSLKDVPPQLLPSLAIDCIPEREDPRDVLVSKSGLPLAQLPPGSRVGTGSLRRRVQLLAFRSDLEVVSIRGNVDTRLRKAESGELDAVVLARAGLNRLGWSARATESIAPEVMLPAVGQGALGIEQRADDREVSQLLAPLSHPDTKILVTAERGVMLAINGNCTTPVAAFGLRQGDSLFLRAFLAEPDGSRPRSVETTLPFPESAEAAAEIGRRLGAQLL
ncbi:MAG TPA: hydroxymethylbilane synthase [Polyangiaceae bacterium]|nr:hydroxymethylbilane synthase [Polyangiaceae bacterium]